MLERGTGEALIFQTDQTHAMWLDTCQKEPHLSSIWVKSRGREQQSCVYIPLDISRQTRHVETTKPGRIAHRMTHFVCRLFSTRSHHTFGTAACQCNLGKQRI